MIYRQSGYWSWDEFCKLPSRHFTADILCVTKWSKLNTEWGGVLLDNLLDLVEMDLNAHFVMAFCDGGYTNNMPLKDIADGKSFVGYRYNDAPMGPEYNGTEHLVVPELKFWKTPKWMRGISRFEINRPGFLESLGYSTHGEPWKEERYYGDRTD